MALTRRKSETLTGKATPRISPPLPARTLLKEFRATASDMGITLYPWQEIAARYLTARAADRWLYGEVAVIVARRSGKTTLLLPTIVQRMRMGHKIIHTAQDRVLPLALFRELAKFFEDRPGELLQRKGRPVWPRRGAGTEEIILANGAEYRIVAPGHGARGHDGDTIIVDELREMDDFEFIQAADPILAVSQSPQFIYVSNAGEENSVVLNAVRDRRDSDPNLAYIEWSAEPELAVDDRQGWLQANPAIGHAPGLMAFLEKSYEKHRLQGTLSIFETEHLCRWVATMRERLVAEDAWQACAAPVGRPTRPAIGVSMDPRGERASIAVAWKDGETVSVRLLYDVTGDPVDTDRLGEDLRVTAARLGVKLVGFDPYTDAELVKYVPKAQAINGGQFANASAQFVNLVSSKRIRWQDAEAVTADLAFTARKPTGENSFHAVRSDDDRPITASLAAIRAAWLASGPQPAIARIM
jgi:hypothetical protein